MRKFLTVAIISVSVSGCALLNSFDNPVSQNDLYKANAAYGLALTAAKEYRQLCVDKVPKVYPTCRTVVPKLQDAVRKVEGARAAAQNFVAANPTITPVSMIAAIQKAIADFQAVEAKYGIGAQ